MNQKYARYAFAFVCCFCFILAFSALDDSDNSLEASGNGDSEDVMLGALSYGSVTITGSKTSSSFSWEYTMSATSGSVSLTYSLTNSSGTSLASSTLPATTSSSTITASQSLSDTVGKYTAKFTEVYTSSSGTTTTSTVSYTIYCCALIIDPNGGTINGSTSNYTIYGTNTSTSVTITLSVTPSRTGYTFTGYGNSITGSGSLVVSTTTFTDYTRTLTAQWEKSTYTVTLNGNGGTTSSGETSVSLTKTYDVSISLSSYASTFTRSGYTLLGWSTSSTATSATYSTSGSYTTNSSKTLYAVWEENVTYYTVTYKKTTSTTYTTESVASGSTGTFPSSPGTISGYTFKGWSTSSSATSATYSAGDSTPTITSAKTYYAVYTATVKLYGNGGTTSSGATYTSYTKNYNSSKSLSTYASTFTYDGYTLSGWNKASDGSGTSYSTTASYSGYAALYAQWTADTYTVTYDSNGGSGDTSETVTAGDSITLPTSGFTKTGYTLTGWTEGSTSGTSYSTGASYTPTEDVTFYAVWTINTYTVQIFVEDLNGWSGAAAYYVLEDIEYNTHIDLDPYIADLQDFWFDAIGDNFLSDHLEITGWVTDSGDDINSITFRVTSDLIIYAVYQVTYTFDFYANGGSFTDGSSTYTVDVSGDSDSQTYDITFNLSDIVPSVTRDGYTLLSWTISVNGEDCLDITPSEFDSHSSLTDLFIDYDMLTDGVSIADIEFYANWTADTYTVTLNGNGGTTDSGGTTATGTMTYGSSLSLAAYANTFTRTGYTLTSWNTASDGSGTTYSLTASYGTNSNVTLYAIWGINSYSVTLSGNEGYTSGNTTIVLTANYGDTLSFASYTNSFTRTGYTLIGWDTSSSVTTPTYTTSNSVTITEQITYYAVWSINSYTIVFDSNGGTGTISDVTKSYGTSITLPDSGVTKTGYTLTSWNTESDGSGTSYGTGSTYLVIEDTTLYAIFTVNNYTVTLNGNGGTYGTSGETIQLSRSYGTIFSLSDYAFTKTGYNLEGWSTSSTASSATYALTDSIEITADITLYAYWELAVCVITYSPSEGTGTAVTQTVNYGSDAVLYTASDVDFTRADYELYGWKTSDGTFYEFGATLSNVTEDITIYAFWNNFAITSEPSIEDITSNVTGQTITISIVASDCATYIYILYNESGAEVASISTTDTTAALTASEAGTYTVAVVGISSSGAISDPAESEVITVSSEADSGDSGDSDSPDTDEEAYDYTTAAIALAVIGVALAVLSIFFGGVFMVIIGLICLAFSAGLFFSIEIFQAIADTIRNFFGGLL